MGPTVDQQWQNLTRSANAAWRGGEKRAAYAYYESALSEAERLLTQAERGTGPAQAAAILVISHHNIAELAREDGQPECESALQFDPPKTQRNSMTLFPNSLNTLGQRQR